MALPMEKLINLTVFMTVFDYYKIASILSASNILLFIILFKSLLDIARGHNKITIVKVYFPLFLLLGISALGIATRNTYQEVGSTLRHTLTFTSLIALFVTIVSYCSSTKQAVKLFHSIVYASIFVSIISVFEFLIWKSFGNNIFEAPEVVIHSLGYLPHLRSSSIVGDPNYLATIAAPSAIACLVACSNTQAKRRALYFFCSMLCFVAVVLSLSRGGILVVSLSLIFLIYRRLFFNRRNFRKVNSKKQIFFVATFLLIGVISVLLLVKLLAGFNPVSYYARASIIRGSLATFLESPIIGHGLGKQAPMRWTEEYLDLAEKAGTAVRTESTEGDLRETHSTILQVLMGTGLMGLFFYIWFIFNTLRMFMKRNNLNRNRLALSIFIGFVVIILIQLFLSIFLVKFFWIWIALMWAMIKVESIGFSVGNSRSAAVYSRA